MTTDNAPGAANKAAVLMMIVALLGMFAWSFAYRASNPSLVSSMEQREGGTPGAPGGEAMNAVMAAMTQLQKNPDDLHSQLDAAEAFASADMWDKALQMLDKASAKAPDDLDVLNLHGVALFRTEKPKEAAAKFSRMLELDPTNFRAQFNLAAVYKYGLNDQAKGKALFEAVTANPKADPQTKDQARQEISGGQ
uniref:Uncharacterized protein n=1 Tax=Fundidesulfovibrio putealis TaxID=270496 RepID=A0A7C4AI74_9BACT